MTVKIIELKGDLPSPAIITDPQLLESLGVRRLLPAFLTEEGIVLSPAFSTGVISANGDDGMSPHDPKKIPITNKGADEFGKDTADHSVPVSKKPATPALDAFGTDITAAAHAGVIDPVIGREAEIERTLQILCRRTKNNPIVIGEAGVGKTALVEGLALRIAAGTVPPELQDVRIINLDLNSMVAGTQYRGEFEERIEAVLAEASTAGNVILFIDEIHTLVGTGNASGRLDAANILKQPLARGEIQCIGATTLEEYRKFIEPDAALTRRFQPVVVDPPSAEDAVRILRGSRGNYERFHGVTYSDEVLKAAVTLSERYVADRHLPDKAIDVIDEAGARTQCRLGAGRTRNDASVPVDMETVLEVISLMSGVPLTSLSEDQSRKLLNLEGRLNKMVVGQPEACHEVARTVIRSRTGLRDPNRPIGSFLFVGPTGVGKTLLSKALAECLFDDRDAVIQLDMSEYMEPHSVARLIGAPPGYVGYEEGGQLTERVRRKPYSVVLFDEIEKAHPDVLNTLLQILEEGRLTDGQGRVVDFRNTIVVMTSNLGAFIANGTVAPFGLNGGGKARREEVREAGVLEEVANALRPEFINRIDKQIVFHALTHDNLVLIAQLEIAKTIARIKEQGVKLSVDTSAQELIVERGSNLSYGARPLRRAVEQLLEDPLAEALLRHAVESGEEIVATRSGDEIKFLKAMPQKETPRRAA